MTSNEKSSAPASSLKEVDRLVVVFGEDDFRVEQVARGTIQKKFPNGAPEMGIEVIEGRAANQNEGLRILNRLFEALDTLSFFCPEKIVWWKNTNLLGDNVTSRTQSVQTRIAELVDFLKEKGLPEGTTLLVTADAVDARKSFYKHAEKAGRVISFKNERAQDAQNEAQHFVEEQLSVLGVGAESRAVSLLLVLTDGDFRMIKSELEKLATFVGPKGTITETIVHQLGSARPGAVVWDLTGAFDRRDISRVIQILDRLAYQQEAPIGLLFAMISHVRELLFLRELIDMNILKKASNPGHLSAQIAKIPASIRAQLPQEKKWNPLMGNPYAIFHRMNGAFEFSSLELRRAMEILLECNEQLVTSGGEFYWLENALLKILSQKGSRKN